MSEPKQITNKDARKDFGKIANIVLVINLIAAAVIYFLKDTIFNQESAYLAGLISGGLMLAAIFSFVILKLMAKKATRIDRVSKD